MSTFSPPRTGADVMAQFIPQSPFASTLGIDAEVTADGEAVAKAVATDKSAEWPRASLR